MGVFYKNNGAITVFLSLILVPILVLAGISIDAIRIYGASAILADSVNLTMNTALANYDQALKDSYGILSMSADENELSNNLIRYFENTINSMGLEFDEEDSYTKSIIDDIKNMISSPEKLDFNNLIDMETVDFSAKGIDGTQLYYPETLKRQVIEYMKYRGLISIGTNFIEKLNIFKEIPKQQEFMESKVEYENSLSDIDSSCKDIYRAILQYNKLKQELNNYSIDDFCKDSENGSEEYFGLRDLNRLTSTLYANKSLVEDILKIDVSTEGVEYHEIYSYFITQIAENATSNIGKLVDKKKAEDIIKYFFDISNNSSEIAKIVKYYKILPAKFEGYCAELIEAFENREAQKKAEAARNKTPYYPGVNTELINAKKAYSALIKQIDSHIVIIKSYCSDTKNRKTYAADLIENNFEKLNLYLHEKYVIVKELRKQSEIACEKLELMLNEIIPEVEQKNKELEEKLKGLEEGDVKNSLKLQHEEISKSINKSEVKKLKDIMLNNKNFYEKYLKNLNSAKYFDIFFIKEIVKFKTNEISKLISFENSNFKLAIDESDKILSNNLFILDSSNLKDLKTKSFESSSFYKYLHKVYKSIDSDNSNSKSYKEEAKGKKDNIFELVNTSVKSYESELDDKKDKNQVPSEGEIYDDLATSLIYLSSSEKTDDISKLSTKENIVGNKKLAKNQTNTMKSGVSIIEALGNFSLELIEGARDKLFITEYISEMFSCHTTNVGGTIEKTLNGFEISEANNYIFGSEIEYVLWGQNGENTDKNNFYTATSIYGLRFVLNTAYAYTDAEIKSFTLAVAVALAGFTGFGVPIVQNILILTLAMAETALDLQKLLAGESTVLYKSYTTWMLKPSSITKEGISYAIKTVTETALNKLSDSIINFAEEKSDAAVNNLEASFDEYAESLLNDISASISNMIFTPIQTELTLYLETNALTDAQLNSTIDDMYARLKNEILKEPESFTKNIKISVLDIFVEKQLQDLKNKINSIFSELGDEVDALRISIDDYIKDSVSELTNTVKTLIFENGYEDLKKEVKKGFKSITDDVKQSASNRIDDFVSKITVGQVTATKPKFKAGISTNLTLNYKEYIKVFLFAGMLAGKENVYISRMCDLIKLNLTCSENAPMKNFVLKNSYTMIKIDSKASVRTTFMTDKFFKNSWDENKFDLKYSFIYGY
jgi:hypothetical protein